MLQMKPHQQNRTASVLAYTTVIEGQHVLVEATLTEQRSVLAYTRVTEGQHALHEATLAEKPSVLACARVGLAEE